MGFRHYKLKTILFIVSATAISFLAGMAVISGHFHLFIVLLLFLIFIIYFIYRHLIAILREILYFFEALKNEDTSIKFREITDSKLIAELHSRLGALNETFQKLYLGIEKREKYFSKILENLSSGIIILSPTGHVNHINTEALRLLGLPVLTHIKGLSKVSRSLPHTIKSLSHPEQAVIELPSKAGRRNLQLSLSATEMLLEGELAKIITLQDLSSEMEKKEIEDWIDIMRILSHEIMNSLAPITSISVTLKELWAENDKERVNNEEQRIARTVRGLDAIVEQSEGLKRFFESYRKLSRIPEPEKKSFPVKRMFDRLEVLISNDALYEGLNIQFLCKDPDLSLKADEQMISNVLINLLRNASQALSGLPKQAINLEAGINEEGKILITVGDNGPGIPPDIKEQIFLPFFTTREKGTGVGLSYSRQVMNMHGGRIEVKSVPGKTEFRLIFRKRQDLL